MNSSFSCVRCAPPNEQAELGKKENGVHFPPPASRMRAPPPFSSSPLHVHSPLQVSALVRGLTYPGLRDGPRTAGRPPILGVRDRVCFVAHNHQEETASSMRQRQNDGVSASKVNGYEVQMVAKTVKYLLLQGYEPDQVRRRRTGSVVRFGCETCLPYLHCACHGSQLFIVSGLW